MKSWSHDDVMEASIYLQFLIDDYCSQNALQMSDEGFKERMTQDITELISEEWLLWQICMEDDFEDIYSFVEDEIDVFFECNGYIPDRISCKYTCRSNSSDLQARIAHLKGLSQPSQHTKEWYAFRSESLTASNIYKAFGSLAQKNSLIYEKCFKEDKRGQAEAEKKVHIPNLHNPRMFGQRYESLSLAFYESQFQTKVDIFGCLSHAHIPFLAASPDGINVSGERFGRLLEIKNIVNREMTGIPSNAYWIQMQIQMEVCDLDACDFVETKFVEMERDEWMHMKDDSFCGIILYFLLHSGEGVYVYSPADLQKECVDEWIQKEIATKKEIEYETFFWKLEKMTCELVERNRLWFSQALPILEEIWSTILTERTEGYAHRAPKQKESTSLFSFHTHS